MRPNPSLPPQMKCRGPERLSDSLKGVQASAARPRLMPGGPRGLRAAAGGSGEQRPRIPSAYQHSGHLGCWLPCRAAVFASAACQGALSWTRGLQRPSSEAGDPSLGNQDGGTAPLSSHLWQLSCEMRGPSAVVQGPEPGACLAGQTRRLAGAPALAVRRAPRPL